MSIDWHILRFPRDDVRELRLNVTLELDWRQTSGVLQSYAPGTVAQYGGPTESIVAQAVRY